MAPKVKKHTEQMICLLCRKEMIYKNLEAHNKCEHERNKLKYKLTHSRDQVSFQRKEEGCGDTSSTSEEKIKEEGLLSPCC